MRDFATLKFFDRFKWVFEKMGIHYSLMRKILQIKLTMDRRRVPTIFNQSSSKADQNDQNHFLKSLGLYAFLGLFLIPFIIMGDQYLFQMSLLFGIMMFIVMTSMISDFSTVLLDVRDRTILSTKPVDRKTISAAKVLHIGVYLFLVTFAIVGVPLLVSLFTKGIGFVFLFVLEIILVDIFIVVLTAFLYLFILRFFDGEKLKDIINYVQIGLSISLIIGYQLLVRSFEFVDVDIQFTPEWWHIFLPPIWFAAPFEVWMGGNRDDLLLFYLALAFILPIIALMIYIKLMPAFEQLLQKLNEHNEQKGPQKMRMAGLLKLICYTKEERVFFRFASHMLSKEREFRLKVYPSLGLALVIPFIFLFNELQDKSLEEVAAGNFYLSIYFSSIMVPTAVFMLKYSGTYKGAWIYKILPVKDFRYLYKGILKAFIIKLHLPLYLLVSAIFLWIYGGSILLDILAVFLSSCLYTAICFTLIKGTLPFSEPFEAAQQNMGWKTIPYLFLLAGFWLIHLFVLKVPFGVLLYILILFITNLLVWRKVVN
ncbi:hypothetical protein SAMN05421676_103184 [Salinibacillus kushneri]|uniref:ABC-2 type transport system permease protein n=1 Tax=Salinibacillus kushneri TaxID=237682 RepID=A0A1I0CI26_9BACI|nr:hypothetical protein [Salinibacillus kushneri]SET19281.1 hypothetical protein SAMN05421676_103184 [Salinibacillus kushneri]